MARVIAVLEAHEAGRGTRKRTRRRTAREGLHAAAEALVCNLAGLALDPLGRALVVPLSNAVMWPGGRYQSPVYGQPFLDALDLMEAPEVRLIVYESGGFRYPRGASQSTTIKPTAAFHALVPSEGVSWGAFRREPPPELIELRATKKDDAARGELVNYDDNAHTKNLREEMRGINAFLANASFWLLPESGSMGLTSMGHLCDPNRRTLRRIFNNGQWNQGGRLYGGFWETMPGEERVRRIRIASAARPDGERIATVDFRQFNPRVAYLQIYLRPPDGDLYDVTGDGSHRAGFKALVNAMLSATSPLRHLPREVRPLFPPSVTGKAAIAAVERFHAPIAHLFGTGLGFQLAAIESTILVTALEIMALRRIVALPLHDAVLVAASETERACDAMEEASASFGEDFRARPAVTFPSIIS